MISSPRKRRAFRPGTDPLEARNAVSSLAFSMGLAGAGAQALGTPLGESPDALYDRVNHVATAELARAAGTAGAHLVFMSSIRAQSGSAVGRPLSEADAPRPTDAYGRSKLAAEAAVRACGARYAILRPVLVYGADAKGNLALLSSPA